MKIAAQILFSTLSMTLLLVSLPARGWQVDTAKTDPCHEKITQGSLAAISPPWGLSETEAEGVLAQFAQKAAEMGVPSDKTTQAFVNDVTDRYGLHRFSGIERFVLASFIAGSRAPDSDGFALLRLREIRNSHLREEAQSPHFLRRRSQDGEQGNAAAAEEAYGVIVNDLRDAWDHWTGKKSLMESLVWTVPFYSDNFRPYMFAPAYYLGTAMHTAQDAFTHTIMDSSFQILAVGNYLDPMLGLFSEARDGPAHSKRMDQCKITQNDFDNKRYTRAMEVSQRLAAQLLDAVELSEFPRTEILARIRELLPIRTGCTLANGYCGSPWVPYAAIDTEKPLNLMSACSVGASAPHLSARPLTLRSLLESLISLSTDLLVFLALAIVARKIVNLLPRN